MQCKVATEPDLDKVIQSASSSQKIAYHYLTTLSVLSISSKKMAEATGKDSGVPIAKLTVGEAESFLNSLMCLPEITNNVEGNFIFDLLGPFYIN